MKSKRILTLLAGIVLVSQAGFANILDTNGLNINNFAADPVLELKEAAKKAELEANEAKVKAEKAIAAAKKAELEAKEAAKKAELEAKKKAEEAKKAAEKAAKEAEAAKKAAAEKAEKERKAKPANITVGDVEKTETTIADVKKDIKAIQKEVKTTTATNAALAGLHPMQFDPLQKTQVMAAVGAYRDKQAVAVGLTHYINENFMVSGGIAGGGDKFRPAGNLGFTWKIGSNEDRAKLPVRYQAGPLSSIYRLQAEVDRLIRENIEMKKIIKENREMKQILDQLILK